MKPHDIIIGLKDAGQIVDHFRRSNKFTGEAAVQMGYACDNIEQAARQIQKAIDIMLEKKEEPDAEQ